MEYEESMAPWNQRIALKSPLENSLKHVSRIYRPGSVARRFLRSENPYSNCRGEVRFRD
jgi:hypothetical protein